jgi:hypothetical protein
MWSEWLVRTLSPRRGEDADPAPRPRQPPHTAPPKDADDAEYNAALAAAEEGE